MNKKIAGKDTYLLPSSLTNQFDGWGYKSVLPYNSAVLSSADLPNG